MSDDALDRVAPDHPTRLGDLVRELGGATLAGDANVEVRGVHHDSRRVQPGDLFVVRKGASADGAKYVHDAKTRGASALLVARGASGDLPAIQVDDVMGALARASAVVYGHPSFGLEVVGVTGTNGKTTTTHLLRTAIDAAKGAPSAGIIGTVAHGFGGFSVPASHTTPEADDLQRLMLAMKRAGAGYVAMEVSSIAIAAKRTAAVRFTVAALTNLTQDHLDYHGTMEAYAAEKAKLFLDYGPGNSVICVDHEFGRSLFERVSGPKLRVSARVGADADVVPSRLALSARGIEGTLKTPRGEFEFRSPLVGAHNVENLVVAIGCVHALALEIEPALAGLAQDLGAPGRLERCDDGDDISVLVDYAHTPDALARVLDALRAVGSKRVVCVFGCGGDRDAKKRGPMGEAVAARADVAIVTSDNPRNESPETIAQPIEEAVRARLSRIDENEIGAARGYVVELDRARAIDLAVRKAAPGDVVLVAGKGHEDYQIVGSEKRPFDDREHARAALARRRAKEAAK
ncbi:MAG TPA: UDP-N-acetylmuramoyl-L-alanyl-D-glutamate--2,6-diaminopimelate ligase [Polyangiaceae bacterium]|jgi:UDP-N-acetylmuramoyl-L-alanyl-D-glutamate--2,6-diaminopimelate ligase